MFTAAAAARKYGKGVKFVESACARGDIPCVRRRGWYFIRDEDLYLVGELKHKRTEAQRARISKGMRTKRWANR